MIKFIKTLFGIKERNTENETEESRKKRFELFKFDGLRAQQMDRTGYAIKCFESALKLEEDFETMHYLTQIYLRINEPDKAYPIVKRMIALEPKLPGARLTLAKLCFLRYDYEGMIAASEEAIALAPKNPYAHFMLAQGWTEMKEPAKAIDELSKAIACKPDFMDAIVARGEAYLSIGEYDKVRGDIEAALALDEEEESALLLRGKLKQANGDDDGAEYDYTMVSELYPFNENALINLGRLYIQQERLAEAIALLDEAIKLNPNMACAYHERGKAKLLNGYSKGADTDLRKELELNSRLHKETKELPTRF